MSILFLVLFLLAGLILGGAMAAWILFGDRTRWGLPTPASLEVDFSDTSTHWSQIAIGDAEVIRQVEAGATGGHFLRLQVKRATDRQLTLAQLDDYIYRSRADYAWRPPVRAEARMRLSHIDKKGSAGFWFWNNAFPLWAEVADFRPLTWMGFQHISPSSRMDFTGIDPRFRASVVRSTWGGMLRMFGLPVAGKLQVVEVGLDTLAEWTQWHTYTIEWGTEQVRLLVDGNAVLQSSMSIPGPLALVLWIDNNWATVSGRHFSVRSEAIDTPQRLDIDYIKVESMLGRQPGEGTD